VEGDGLALSMIGDGKSDGCRGLLPNSTEADDDDCRSSRGGSIDTVCGSGDSASETAARGASRDGDGKENTKAPNEVNQLTMKTRARTGDNRKQRLNTL